MGVEVERKFLVTGDAWRSGVPEYFCQGYLNREPERTVRVRVAGDRAWLTIKGRNEGATRPEFEYAIPAEDGHELLALCEQPLIEKNRFRLEFDGLTWEIDEFLGANEGLIVAEVELEFESQEFRRPDWVGPEVTSDNRYFNSQLSQHPYQEWNSATTD